MLNRSVIMKADEFRQLPMEVSLLFGNWRNEVVTQKTLNSVRILIVGLAV
jgi:hypothetical protein